MRARVLFRPFDFFLKPPTASLHDLGPPDEPRDLLAEIRKMQGEAATALTLLSAGPEASSVAVVNQSPTDMLRRKRQQSKRATDDYFPRHFEKSIDSARHRIRALTISCMELLLLLLHCAEDDLPDMQLRLDSILANIKPGVNNNMACAVFISFFAFTRPSKQHQRVPRARGRGRHYQDGAPRRLAPGLPAKHGDVR